MDLTLRRVTNPEKTQKLKQWKKDKKADSIMKIAADDIKASESKIPEIKNKIIEEYGSLYDAFEKSMEGGEGIFSKIGLTPERIKALTKVIKSRIKLEKVNVKATIELSSFNPDGIGDIKNTVLNVKKSRKKKESDLRVYAIGAPKYCVEVSADDYPEAEKILMTVVEDIITGIENVGGSGRRLS